MLDDHTNATNRSSTSYHTHRVSKNICYLIFYNLKKAEPIFVIFGIQHPIILAQKSICNFTSNLTLTDFTVHFFRVVEIMYFHASL